jgi:hypothetical protein
MSFLLFTWSFDTHVGLRDLDQGGFICRFVCSPTSPSSLIAVIAPAAANAAVAFSASTVAFSASATAADTAAAAAAATAAAVAAATVELTIVHCLRKRHHHHHHQRTNGSTIVHKFTSPDNLVLFNLSTVV